MAQCVATLKKLSLELGGNAPFIVFEDADLDAAVALTIASKHRNTGQTCVCANRLLVQASIYDEFVSKLSAAVAKLTVGDGLAGRTDQGPLIDAKALAKVEEHIADALAKGARIALGGARHALGGTFFQPTILTDVNCDMMIAREETFGPVAPLFRFKSEEEALRRARSVSSICSSWGNHGSWMMVSTLASSPCRPRRSRRSRKFSRFNGSFGGFVLIGGLRGQLFVIA